MLHSFFNYSKKYISPLFAMSYGIYLNYSFYEIVMNDYKHNKKKHIYRY